MAPHPALLALLLLAAAHSALADDHDCIVGSPPLCNHSLASDPLCRGIMANNKTAWQSMDCDCELGWCWLVVRDVVVFAKLLRHALPKSLC
jgi:hypothetical protein